MIRLSLSKADYLYLFWAASFIVTTTKTSIFKKFRCLEKLIMQNFFYFLYKLKQGGIS